MTSPSAGSRLGAAFVQVRADVSQFARSARTQIQRGITAAARALNWRPFSRSAAAAGAAAGTQLGNGLVRGADGRLRDMRGRFVSEGALAGRLMSRAFGSTFDLDLPRLGPLGALGPMLLKIAGAGAAVAKVLPVVVGLIGELGTAGLAAAASLPFLIVAMKTITGTFKLAVKGVSDAVKSIFDADPAKLQEALKNLTPAARSFVLEIAKAKPILERIQKDAQEAFFKPLKNSFNDLVSSAFFTVLRKAMREIAADAGQAATDILRVVTAATRSGQIDTILGQVTELFANLAGIAGKAASAFVTLAVAAGPFVNVLVDSMVGGLTSLFELIEAAADDGRLQEMFEQALLVIGQVGAILFDLGSIFSSVFGAAGEAGQPVLGTFALLTQELARFLKTAEAQGALQGLFSILGELSGIIVSVVKPLLPIVAQVVQAFAGPLLRVIQAVAPPLARLARVFAEVAAPIIEKLAPVIGILIDGLGEFLSRALSEVAVHMEKMLPVLDELMEALGPELIPLAEALVEALLALLPVLPAISEMIITLTPLLIKLIPVFTFMVQLTTNLWKGIAILIGWIVQLIAFVGGFTAKAMVASIDQLIAIIKGIPGFIEAGINAIKKMFGALDAAWDAAFEAARDTWNKIKDTVSSGVRSVVDGIGSIPGKIRSFVGGIAGAAADIGRAIGNGIANIPGFAVDVASRIVDRIRGFANSVIGSINSGIGRLDALIPFSLPRIPFLADGAIINQPTLAVLGERGNEVVLPLDNPTRARELADEAGLSSLLGAGFGDQPPPNVQVFIGDEEITDRVDVRIVKFQRGTARELSYGARGI